MELGFAITPSPAGLALAAGAVALGAPLFSDGLRALRLRRQFAGLRPAALAADLDGFAHARGLVALESPLFSPLSGKPCAGYSLWVSGEGTAVRRVVEERRPFRLVDGEHSAQVPGAIGRWSLSPTATRRIAAGEPLSENLAALLARVPEAVWLRRSGVTLELEERSLLAGRECHVVGTARSSQSVVYVTEELARTGTDDAAGESVVVARTPETDIAFHGGDHLDFLLVSDHAPDPADLRVAPIRLAGVVLGPAVSLLGILYLAAVADLMRAAGRF